MPETAPVASESAIALVDRALASGAFSPRPLSWTASLDGHFLKIPRCGASPSADLRHERARHEAAYEFRSTRVLSLLSDAVPEPIAFVEGCFIAPALEVTDLRDELLAPPHAAGAASVIDEVFRLVGGLHRASRRTPPALPRIDYARERLWNGTPAMLARLAERPVTVIARGLEIRNLLRDRASGALVFVDPHEVGLGAPEEDVARVVLSLLMLRWGRRSLAGPWTGFSLGRALGIYADAFEPVDREVLAAMMRLNVAMRREHADAAARSLPPFLRRAGLLYVRWFFSRLERWSGSNGL